MIFSEFCTAVRNQVFPEGEAENLIAVHQNWIVDALIKLQQRVLCQQAKHVDLLVQAATKWNCGATVFDVDRGFILRLKTVPMQTSNRCAEVLYMPSTRDEIECRIREAENCATDGACCNTGMMQAEPYQYCGPYFDYGYTLGMRYANSTNDRSCRASEGIYALDDGQIWVYPAIRSDEMIMLEWRGIKRAWNDSDPVEFDREAQESVELFLEWKVASKEDCDAQKRETSRTDWEEKIGDLIWQCRKERRLPQPAPCFANCECVRNCTGKPMTPPACAPGNHYFYGAENPNGVIDGNIGDIYTQISQYGGVRFWTKTEDGSNTGWV
jgi:hypothetical protein